MCFILYIIAFLVIVRQCVTETAVHAPYPATWTAAACWRVALETKGWTLVCSGLVHVWVPSLWRMWRFTDVWVWEMMRIVTKTPRHGMGLADTAGTTKADWSWRTKVELRIGLPQAVPKCPISGLSRSSSRVVHLHELIIVNQIPYSRRHPQVITCKNQFLDTPILFSPTFSDLAQLRYVGNACGTIACIHSIGNNSQATSPGADWDPSSLIPMDQKHVSNAQLIFILTFFWFSLFFHMF